MNNGHKPVVMVIDDEEAMREMLQRTLELAGYTVVVAENGEKGIEYFETVVPDLVITDIIMPVKEGIETIVAIRKSYPGTKILAISGGHRNSSYPALDMAAKLGADAILNKPFRRETLFQVLEKILRFPGGPETS